jgi:hypothetical protein
LPLILRTGNEAKRERFAQLLTRAAREDAASERDSARTMALILDQLEFPQVRLLDKLVTTPGEKRNGDYAGQIILSE